MDAADDVAHGAIAAVDGDQFHARLRETGQRIDKLLVIARLSDAQVIARLSARCDATAFAVGPAQRIADQPDFQ